MPTTYRVILETETRPREAAVALDHIPAIFIASYRRDETVAKALEAGAADYLVKPFSPTELVARVGAALRRREEPEPFVVGDLAIEYAQRRVTVGGEAVDLTATEYELLPRRRSAPGGRRRRLSGRSSNRSTGRRRPGSVARPRLPD